MRIQHPKMLFALACLFGIGCSLDMDFGFEPKPPNASIALTIEGTITSARDGTAIAGALITFGAGGSFLSYPMTRKTADTDQSGGYVVRDSLSYNTEDCPFLWVTATAQGYQTNSYEDYRVKVSCTEQRQQIDIRLEPRP